MPGRNCTKPVNPSAIGLRGLDAGPLANAVAVEAMTPVLMYINKRYKIKGSGIKITGLDAPQEAK